MTKQTKFPWLAVAIARVGAVSIALLIFHPAPAGGPVLPTFSDSLNITNVFVPFPPGGVKVFVGRKDGKKSVVTDLYTTTTRTFPFNGGEVDCRMLIEEEFNGGDVSEISKNFFAQADDGSVYYFGEVVDVYESGVVVNHEGSWLVGGPSDQSDPAETATATSPGLFMTAAPARGDSFKPEDVAPVVDETDTIIKTNVTVQVPAGRFTGSIQVQETSQLDNDRETKWYGPGVGVLRAVAKGETLTLLASSFRNR